MISKDAALAATLNDGGKSLDEALGCAASSLTADAPVEVSNLLKLLIQSGDVDLLPDVSAALVPTR